MLEKVLKFAPGKRLENRDITLSSESNDPPPPPKEVTLQK